MLFIYSAIDCHDKSVTRTKNNSAHVKYVYEHGMKIVRRSAGTPGEYLRNDLALTPGYFLPAFDWSRLQRTGYGATELPPRVASQVRS